MSRNTPEQLADRLMHGRWGVGWERITDSMLFRDRIANVIREEIEFAEHEAAQDMKCRAMNLVNQTVRKYDESSRSLSLAGTTSAPARKTLEEQTRAIGRVGVEISHLPLKKLPPGCFLTEPLKITGTPHEKAVSIMRQLGLNLDAWRQMYDLLVAAFTSAEVVVGQQYSTSQNACMLSFIGGPMHGKTGLYDHDKFNSIGFGYPEGTYQYKPGKEPRSYVLDSFLSKERST